LTYRLRKDRLTQPNQNLSVDVENDPGTGAPAR
jgi:hypothetical protein